MADAAVNVDPIGASDVENKLRYAEATPNKPLDDSYEPPIDEKADAKTSKKSRRGGKKKQRRAKTCERLASKKANS